MSHNWFRLITYKLFGTFLLENKMTFYSNLMTVEFCRRNFGAAIYIYKKLFQKDNLKMKMKMEILSNDFPSLQLKYHEALLRKGKGSIETFISSVNCVLPIQ